MLSNTLETQWTKTTCCYCGVGCGVLVETERCANVIRIKSVKGDPDHPANLGRLCIKGATLDLTAQPHIYEQSRAKYPELRDSRHMARRRIDWDTAYAHVAEKFADIISRHGPDSVGIYVSGQLLTEDYYVFNKLAKGLIGTNNIDTNSRLCMSSAVAGYKQTLGADAPPCNYEDIDHASTIFITGSNAAYAHPVLFRRIEAAKEKNPDLKLIVVDPRLTDTARTADLFLQILPGTDVALYHGMLHIMLWEGLTDPAYIDAHTEGFSALKELVKNYTPKAVAEICGIAETDLNQAARLFAQSSGTLSLYCQGLNQSASGTSKNTALINLHLATAQIGRAGAGPFSLTGQPNAMGGREVGGLANLLSAHRDLGNPEHRREVAEFWGVRDVPAKPGLTAVPMFEALRSGQLKAIWIVCTNPAQSLPDQTLVHEALNKAEFVVVQDAYANTATTAYADVLLPATTWGEKSGTVTNSERRISRVRPALAPWAECKNDWEIALGVARLLEAKLPAASSLAWRSLFNFADVQSVWEEHRESTRGRDLDITGLSYAILERDGPQYWPYPTGATQGKPRLYEDGIYPTATGRARFVSNPYRAPADPTDARYPFAMTTGRLRDQWHGMSRTGTVARLYSHAPQACIDLSPLDGRRLNIADQDLVYVTSRRGMQVMPVNFTDSVRPSQAFVAMHWGSEFLSGKPGKFVSQGINSLTSPAIDPDSQQPELKFAAVKITRADLPWHVIAFAWIDASAAVALQVELRALFPHTTFATATLFGRDDARHQTGVFLRLAHTEAFEPAFIQRIAQYFGLDTANGQQSIMTYQDKRRSVMRQVKAEHGRSNTQDTSDQQVWYLCAALLTGSAPDVSAAGWLREYLESFTDVRTFGRRLLTPGANPPQPVETRGKVVCNCFNVQESSISQFLVKSTAVGREALLQALQASLSCGTNCGSCLPEIKTMISQHVD